MIPAATLNEGSSDTRQKKIKKKLSYRKKTNLFSQLGKLNTVVLSPLWSFLVTESFLSNAVSHHPFRQPSFLRITLSDCFTFKTMPSTERLTSMCNQLTVAISQ